DLCARRVFVVTQPGGRWGTYRQASPRRPGTAPALGLRAEDASFTEPQTVRKEPRMNRHARPALLLALLGGVLLVTAARSSRDPRAAEAHFASGEELLRLAAQEGLLCYDGSRLPEPWSGYFLTDRPRNPVELENLCKARCGQLPEWDGVLWAFDLSRS